jgi:hypothetical protein
MGVKPQFILAKLVIYTFNNKKKMECGYFHFKKFIYFKVFHLYFNSNNLDA